MKPTYICPQCLRTLADACTDCWECGLPAVLKKTAPSNPGVATAKPGSTAPGRPGAPASRPVSSAPGCSTTQGTPRRGSALSALATLIPVIVLIGAMMYWSPVHFGRLTIQTEPAGAAVKVGNQVLGLTPLQIEGNPGEYWVTLQLDAHEEVAARVRIPLIGNAIAQVPLRRVQLPMLPRDAPRSRLEGAKTAAARARTHHAPPERI